MVFWSIAAVMIAVAALFVLWPLRSGKVEENVDPRKLVLLERLREIEAEGKDRADERAQIARQIIALDERGSSFRHGGRSIVVASVLGLIALPALVIPLYLTLGSSAQALSARGEQPLENQSMEVMVAAAERHLASNPDDVQGWAVLARVYGSQGQLADRINALENLERLQPKDVDVKTDLAQALSQASGNIIPDRAVSLLDEALNLEPDHEKGNFFRAAAYEQAGKGKDALAIWQKLAKVRTDDPEWQKQIGQRIAALSSPAPSIAAQTQRALENAPADVREQMILGMVEGLAERLADQPDDIQGWQRLFQAYTVLGTPEIARNALDVAIAKQNVGSPLAERLTGLRNTFGEVD